MKLVELGRVGRPHGIRGEVRVQLHFAQGDTLLGVASVVVSQKGKADRTYGVISARPAGKGVLLALEGVEDRDAADLLRGATISVPRGELPEPEEGEYYLCDLMGARVVGPSGDVGEVIEIRVHPSVDCLVIQTPDGKTLEQPLVEPWIERVDVEEGIVELSSTDGLV